MCYVNVGGVKLYHEVHGSGEPLLMILGLAGHIAEVPFLVESYGKHFQLIAYDKRGCGRSENPTDEQSIAGLADEAAGLLDALGVPAAFVYGSSLGGMVAQELALNHPERVRGLILGCTTAGAIRGVPPAAETIATMVRNQSLSGDEGLAAGWKLGYSDAYVEANREAMVARCRAASAYGAPPDSYMRQVLAAAKHDTYDRLGKIACPVMIIHGELDVMIPPGNARLLADGIPHAELHILEGMGHGYNLEAQAQADALIIDFVRRHAGSRADEQLDAVR